MECLADGSLVPNADIDGNNVNTELFNLLSTRPRRIARKTTKTIRFVGCDEVANDGAALNAGGTDDNDERCRNV